MARMTYAACYQVKQYVAVVRNSFGQRFMVFVTGDPKFYLFSALIGETMISGGLQFPVAKKSLTRELRSALRHGWGNSS